VPTGAAEKPLVDSDAAGDGVQQGQCEHPPLALLPRRVEPERLGAQGKEKPPRVFICDEEKSQPADNSDVPLREAFKAHTHLRDDKVPFSWHFVKRALVSDLAFTSAITFLSRVCCVRTLYALGVVGHSCNLSHYSLPFDHSNYGSIPIICFQ